MSEKELQRISKDIESIDKDIKKLDKRVDKVEDIPRYAKEIEKMYNEIINIEEKIQKITDKEKKNECNNKLDKLKQNMADFISDANVDGFLGSKKVDEQTQEKINELNGEYRKQMEQIIKDGRKYLISVGFEHKEIFDQKVDFEKNIRKFADEIKEGEAETGLLGKYQIGGYGIWNNYNGTGKSACSFNVLGGESNKVKGELETKIKELGLTYEVFIKDGEIIILGVNSVNTLKEQGLLFGIKYKTRGLTINGDDISSPGYIETTQDNKYYNIIKQTQEIIDFSSLSPSEKWNELIKIGKGFLNETEKIMFLKTVATYFDAKYDRALYDEKKNIVNKIFSNKSASKDDMLSKDPSGVCGDHHRLVSQLAKEIGMDAGCISITSSGLHVISCIKSGDDYILLDYGDIYRGKNLSALMARYYANHGSTPKPFDIMTDENGKLIGLMRTKTGEKIAEYMSPFDVTSSRDAVLNMWLNGTKPIETSTDVKVDATNNKQKISYNRGNGKTDNTVTLNNEFKVENTTDRMTNLNFQKRRQTNKGGIRSTKTGFTNTQFDNESNKNNANSIYVAGGYQKEGKPIQVAGVKLYPSSVIHAGLGFDFEHKDISYNNPSIDEGSGLSPGGDNFPNESPGNIPIKIETKTNPNEVGIKKGMKLTPNQQAPQFIGDASFGLQTEKINLGNNTDVKFRSVTTINPLPKDITNPIPTMRLNPQQTLGMTTNIKTGEQSNISLGTDYTFGLGQKKIAGNLNRQGEKGFYASASGSYETNQDPTGNLTNQLMYDVQVGWINKTNKKWIPNVSVGTSGSYINGQKQEQTTGVNLSYNLGKKR